MRYRVFFDGNAGNPETGYLLHFDLSLKDLQEIPEPREGTPVLLYDPGELEAEARLTFDPEWNCWVGVPTGPFRTLG
jgi:hypothetical protein